MTRVALAIAADHPAFAGHFPSRPVVPGVVLLDAALRALATPRPSIASAKFVSFVAPGEAVHLDVDPADATRLSIYAGAGPHERVAVSAVLRRRVDASATTT